MFRKLLKHDIKAVFKYWWIAAAASVAFSFLAILCIKILNVEYTEYDAVYNLANIGLILCIFGIAIFPLLNIVLNLQRFHNNFFTDEGYLTFTLPVKKSQLINSKLATLFLFEIFTSLVILADIFLILSVGVPEFFFNTRLWNIIFSPIKQLIETVGIGFSLIYIIEALIFATALTVLFILILFVCLTISTMITRKHKILSAILIYYAINSVFSFIPQFLMMIDFQSFYDKIILLAPLSFKICISVLLLGVATIVIVVSLAFYLLVNVLFDKKLNLE